MNKIPSWFYILAGVALCWNLLGAAMVMMNFMISPEQIAALPQEQQQMYADTPKWASYSSLIAVIAGSLGSFFLFVKKSWAQLMFIVSLIGLVAQNIGLFIVVDALGVMGPGVLVMQSLVFIIAIGLWLLSKKAIKQQWLA